VVRLLVNSEQKETVMGQVEAFRVAFSYLRASLLFLMLGWALAAHAKTAPPSFAGVVSIADGEPFTLVRGTSLNTATKGVTLAAGDMVGTGPGAFLAIEMPGAGLLGIGPSTQIYFMQRSASDPPTLVVLKGWVKADIRTGSKGPPVRVTGTRLGIQSHQAVVLLYADERSDSVFDEQGAATLLLRDEAGTHTGKETQTNQFFMREERADLVSQPRPSPEFVAKMPVPFRDPLPENASAKLKKATTPQFVREVNYSDVQQWLNMPRDWRAGFIGRFRGRLKDPAFFAAMDASMGQHPEWQPILHPPPPPEEDARIPTPTRPTPH
jgi:hypothetical protein